MRVLLPNQLQQPWQRRRRRRSLLFFCSKTCHTNCSCVRLRVKIRQWSMTIIRNRTKTCIRNPHTLYSSALDAPAPKEEETMEEENTGERIKFTLILYHYSPSTNKWETWTESPQLLPRSVRRPVPTVIRDRIIKATQPNHRDNKDKPKVWGRTDNWSKFHIVRHTTFSMTHTFSMTPENNAFVTYI